MIDETGGHYHAYYECDACHDGIEINDGSGAFLWFHDGVNAPDGPYFAHKGGCHRRLVSLLTKGRNAYWHELRTFKTEFLIPYQDDSL